ncbi:hypothetical protein H6G25_05785 [Dolichospermum sp. FACHB-1091]|uniref:hypothetical protein n=1 Tax=Dolichospermum sp. FACHB-1091 TaxID=2692798 RepID=UPI001680E6D2|nr:hypothetical protein [Dolichospermum sp. FACHB-1091]MBD2442722.1 hypothetical protein [Dolichospermum sp. FACHB-1091]
MENSSLNWQDSLNPQLLQRLILLGKQPGIIKQDIGQKIIDRCDRFLNRLPLLSQYLQRWQGLNEMSVDSVPIVYALPALRESENNQTLTVNQTNNLASNTEKTIQTKTASSQTPSAASNYLTENREPNTANPIVIQPSTGNEIAPAIEMPLVTNSESLEAIATSSTMIPGKFKSETSDSINKKNSISLTQNQTVHPLAIIDNFLSSNQTYSLINNGFKKEDPLPIAKSIDRNSNFSERKYLIVNPLLQDNAYKLLSENKSIQERPLSLPISSTNSSLINYSENRKQRFNRSLEEPITEEFLIDSMILEQRKIKLPVVKISHQYPSENIQKQLPMPPFNSSKMPRVNVKTVGDRSAIAAPLPLASRSPSLSSSANFDVQSQSPQQSPEVPKVFAVSSPPTETRISPIQTTPPKVNLEAIADQVERKIMRRLVIESERRGQKR